MKVISLVALFIFLGSTVLEACSIFSVKCDEGVYVGRNFDWDDPENEGSIWFIPETGNSYGYSIVEIISETMPYEGVNNQGLFVGIASVPDSKVPLNIFKPMRKSLEMIEVILKEASTVEEALAIFPKYTVLFGMFLDNPLVHFKIVDSLGDSAIVEYIDKEIVVIRENQKWSIVTNHFLTDSSLGADSETSFERFNIIKKSLQENKTPNEKELHKILDEASQKATVWGSLYNLNKLSLSIKSRNNEVVKFNILEELGRGKHGYRLDELNKMESVDYKVKKSKVMFRPHAGYGISKSSSETFSHVGGRLLLNAGDKKYGIDVTYFDAPQAFTSIGVMLEQRPFGWFNMSIGSVGYLGYGEDKDNLFGYSSSLGWEPDNSIGFLPFVTFRTDVIFADEIELINSFSAGFSVKF